MTGIDFPSISPIIFEIGPLAIRWYSMAYLVGIIFGWLMIIRNSQKYQLGLDKPKVEDFMFYVTLGIILGGRLGYAIFYGGKMMWLEPWHLLEIWKGGMSFHGGVFGVIAATYVYARKIDYSFLRLTDLAVLYAPLGIFLGRLANFANDELWGRVSNVPWAVKFPSGGYLPRHPSQLYEAFLEGLLVFVILNFLWRFAKVREAKGLVSALFVLMYGVFRMLMEQFREPDAQLGFLFGSVTMGQLLSVPLVVLGLVVIYRSLKLSK